MTTSLEADPREEASARGLTLEPRIHILLPDGHFLSALKKLTRRKDLFLYFHRRARSFVIAAWLYPPSSSSPRLCSEIEILPNHPDSGCLDLQEMAVRIRMTLDSQVSHMKKKLIRLNRERRSNREIDLAERNDMVRYLTKKGLVQAATLIDTGQGHWLGARAGGENLDRVKEQLTELARLNVKRTYAYNPTTPARP